MVSLLNPSLKGAEAPTPVGMVQSLLGAAWQHPVPSPTVLPGESVPAHIHTYIHYDILF